MAVGRKRIRDARVFWLCELVVFGVVETLPCGQRIGTRSWAEATDRTGECRIGLAAPRPDQVCE
jgi:hypothetical protein